MFEVIYRLFEMAALVLCLHSLSGEKAKPDIYNVGFIAIELTFMQMIQDEIVSKQMYFVVYLLYFVYAYVKFNDTIKRTVLKCLLATLIICGLQIVFYVPMYFLSLFIPDETVIVLIINAAILLFFIITRKSKMYKQTMEFCASKDWILRICILLCATVVVYCMITIKQSSVIKIDIYILFSIFMIMFLTFLYRWQKSTYELERKEREIQITNLYNDAFKELIETTRRRQHDFQNQIDAIYGMHLTAKSLEELVEAQKEYCDKLVYENRYFKVLSCTSNSTLAGFIYTKFVKAEKSGIEVGYDISFTENTPITVYDLVEIIGILMDNAIEAMTDSSLPRKIIFDLKDYGGLDLTVKNPVSGITNNDILKFFESGYSTKGSGRGIGLSKVKEYQKKYQYNICVGIDRERECEWLKIQIVENI